ncbi:hypothetical protein DUNSADRAFT_14065 [Dunaliella salina]|uniref:Secreted protein n=1 Tax=Dunaliella salina TaxID=3046 RepID=A0ABQ7G862_DUNSA|nr:hypothetical protein DUNSADRAFT_14065 [Dunaliella salina]|eukprot:KAF5830782.1 hypothetical protein DUNSADRAFT_14065 [Dunaliella salina]
MMISLTEAAWVVFCSTMLIYGQGSSTPWLWLTQTMKVSSRVSLSLYHDDASMEFLEGILKDIPSLSQGASRN